MFDVQYSILVLYVDALRIHIRILPLFTHNIVCALWRARTFFLPSFSSSILSHSLSLYLHFAWINRFPINKNIQVIYVHIRCVPRVLLEMHFMTKEKKQGKNVCAAPLSHISSQYHLQNYCPSTANAKYPNIHSLSHTDTHTPHTIHIQTQIGIYLHIFFRLKLSINSKMSPRESQPKQKNATE